MKDLYNFEKNLKRKLEEQEFPFDEKNWEKARVMIDASRNNRKPWVYYVVSAVVITISSSFIYYFVSNNQSENKNRLLAVNEKGLVIQEQQSVSEVSNSVSISDKNATNTLASDLDTKSVNFISESKNASSANSVTKNISSKSRKKSTSVSKNTTDNLVTDNHNNIQQNSHSSDVISEEKSSPKNSPSSLNSNSEHNRTKPTDKSKSSNITEIPPVLGSNNSQSEKSTIISPSGVDGNNNKIGQLSQNQNNSSETKTKVTDSAAVVQNSNAIETKITVSDTSSIIPIAKLDSVANNSTVVQETPYKVKIVKHIVSAELGTTYLFGWNNGITHEASGFNITGGLNYQHNFSNLFSLSTGIHYNSINNLSSTYTVSRVKYDFGVQKEVTSINYIRLHYITVPLKLGVNIGKHNQIGLGGYFNTLLNSECRTDKYRTKNSEPTSESNLYSSRREQGYLAGFNAYQIQASVFYRLTVYKRLSVNAEFVLGLTDIKNNKHFNNNTIEKATGAKLSLSYDLFKK